MAARTGPVAEFCAGLKRLRQASGCDPVALARRLSISRTQLYAILNGEIKRPPDWARFVAPLVEACTSGDARAVAEWRRRHGVLVGVWEELSRQNRQAPPPGGTAATQTLPRDLSSFTGRDRDLAQLVTTKDGGCGAAAIYVIGGMAGVGKTALAVHAGHQLAGRFPDGQLFIPLHGHTPGSRPVDPADALGSLLLTAGVDARQIPPGLEARARLWRDRLAGQQLLLLLDDAVTSEQVRPLLPGTGECLVLVTSRRRLTALEDARAISLDILTADEAADLLVRLAARPGLAPDDPAVAQIAGLSGYLPLALGMMGRRLYHRPAWEPAELAAELAAARDRLELMDAEGLSVASVFGLSYRDLTEGQQRFFRCLGLHPGTDIDAWAAAALDGGSPAVAGRHLDALYDQHLITEPARGRYRLHDLIREHAMALAATDPPAEREAAIGRLLDYYLHAARAADRYLARRPRAGTPAVILTPPAGAPELSSRDDAIAWMETERLNLHAAVECAQAHNRAEHVIAIPAAMHAFLCAQGHLHQGLALQHAALDTARQSGDRQAQAGALSDLSAVQSRTADLPAVAASLLQALELYRELSDPRGEADALTSLGHVQYLTDDHPAATAYLTQALELYRELGDRWGEADALTELGYVQYVTDDFTEATASLSQALELYRVHDDWGGQVGALNYLASVQKEKGQCPAAIASYTQALGLCRANGDQNGEAGVLTGLGHAQCLTGELSPAVTNLTRALQKHRAHGNPLGEASALNYLGLAQRLTGDHRAAVASQKQALELYRAVGSQLGEANAWQELGTGQQLAGDLTAAAVSQQRALELYRAIGERLGEAETLNNIGDLLLASSKPAEAQASHEQALTITRGITAPLERARALEGIGRCHLRTAKPAEAETLLRQALAIYEELGSPSFSRVQATLQKHDR